jgi:hypothetical protein
MQFRVILCNVERREEEPIKVLRRKGEIPPTSLIYGY